MSKPLNQVKASRAGYNKLDHFQFHITLYLVISSPLFNPLTPRAFRQKTHSLDILEIFNLEMGSHYWCLNAMLRR